MINQLFGQGFNYPLVIDNRGRVPVDSSVELIRTSIRGIIAWTVGTRYFDAEFGVNIERYLLEPNDTQTANIISSFLTRAIARYEPRVRLSTMETQIRGTQMSITYSYLIQGIKVDDTLTYTIQQ